MSLGVSMRLNLSVAGSHRIVWNLPASNCLSLPDPATIRTLPVRSSAAWIALTRIFSGTDRIDQWPLRSL